jgi:purine nucleoside permease
MVTLDALVLPAFDDLEGLPSETAPWHERHELEHTLEIPGLPVPLAHDRRLGVAPTGVGKAAAATTVTALLSSPALDIGDALVCSVGVAGGPPEIPVGSVVVADTVLDWDDKCRFGGGELALDPYTGDQGVFELDADLVERARAVATGVELSRPTASNERPVVTGGVNLCGDELWHGAELADQVGWLLDERGVGEYRATEMEDVGTASALARFGRLDRYLTVRGISNHDRPAGDRDPAESLLDPAFESGFGVAAENAARVAGAVLEDIRDVS